MSFQQGLSGLNATSKSLEIIGNNIANANTYGAKTSRAEFADVYANALNGAGANSVGIGVNMASVAQQFTQGNISTTDNMLDLAVNGPGFFQVQQGSNPPMFTRNGQFRLDGEGNIVTNSRLNLLGYPADNLGNIVEGPPVPLRLPTSGINPKATDGISIEMNLDSREKVTRPASGPPIVFGNPKTYNNASSLTTFDENGKDVTLTFYFQKAAEQTWDVYVTANGTPVHSAAGAPAPTTRIVFPEDGRAPTRFEPFGAAPVEPAGPFTFSIDNPGPNTAGAQPLPIEGILLDLGSATQYGSPFAVTDVSQTGYTAGQLSGVTVEANGIVMARYSNGQSKPAGQVELVNIRNPQGLQAMGGNVWSQTYLSGDPIRGTPGSGNFGALQAGALEESNVDLTAELVNMITAQRSYQANAQTIKTTDQVLQTLVNLR